MNCDFVKPRTNNDTLKYFFLNVLPSIRHLPAMTVNGEVSQVMYDENIAYVWNK